jgi:hypothetical protein
MKINLNHRNRYYYNILLYLIVPSVKKAYGYNDYYMLKKVVICLEGCESVILFSINFIIYEYVFLNV